MLGIDGVGALECANGYTAEGLMEMVREAKRRHPGLFEC